MQNQARDDEAVRVLLVEDSAEDAELNLAELERAGLCVTDRRVDDEAGLREALAEFRPDIVLSDLSLPGYDGYAALRLVRGQAPGLPFLFVSGTMGEEAAVEALRQGAADYILKHNMARLGAAVRRALHEARLEAERRQAQQDLLRAQRLESLALIAGGLGHDLRNLLQPLLIVPSILGEREDDAQLKSVADLVHDCAARGLDIVNSMLSFARGDAGPGEQVEVDELFDALQLLVASQLGPGVALELAGTGEGLMLPGNRTGIQQALLNLALNGAQAMPDGGRLLLGAAPGPDDTLVLYVEDSGSGMSQDAQAHLFTPFFTTKPGGSGLGLYTCRRIVEQHGGWMKVRSEQGTGTRIELHFPLLAEETGSFPQPGMDAPLRVLIIDEQPGRPVRLARNLEAGAFSCQVAHEAASALQQLADDQAPDVLVITAQACRFATVPPLALFAQRFPGRPVLLLTAAGETALPRPAGLDVHEAPADSDPRTLRRLLRDLAGMAAPG